MGEDNLNMKEGIEANAFNKFTLIVAATLSFVVVCVLSGELYSQNLIPLSSSEGLSFRQAVHIDENINNDGLFAEEPAKSLVTTIREFDRAVESEDVDYLESLMAQKYRILRLGQNDTALEYTPAALIADLPSNLDIVFGHTFGEEHDVISARTFFVAESEFFLEAGNAIFMFRQENFDRLSGVIFSPLTSLDYELGDAHVLVSKMPEERFLFSKQWRQVVFDLDLAEGKLRDLSSEAIDVMERDSGEYSVVVVPKRPLVADTELKVKVESVSESGLNRGAILEESYSIENFSRRAVFEVSLDSSAADSSGLLISVWLDDKLLAEAQVEVVDIIEPQ